MLLKGGEFRLCFMMIKVLLILFLVYNLVLMFLFERLKVKIYFNFVFIYGVRRVYSRLG